MVFNVAFYTWLKSKKINKNVSNVPQQVALHKLLAAMMTLVLFQSYFNHFLWFCSLHLLVYWAQITYSIFHQAEFKSLARLSQKCIIHPFLFLCKQFLFVFEINVLYEHPVVFNCLAFGLVAMPKISKAVDLLHNFLPPFS